MYKLCNTEQTVQRQKEIALILLSELEKKTFDEITVTDLCRKADIPRKAFYRYFSDKTGALYALIDIHLLSSEQFIAKGADPDPFSREKILHLLHYCQQYPNLFYAIEANKLWNEMFDRTYSFLARRYPSAISPENNGNSYGSYFLIGGITTTLHFWFENGFKEDSEVIVESIFRNIEQFVQCG